MKAFLIVSLGVLTLAACGDDETIADQRGPGAAATSPAAPVAEAPSQAVIATERPVSAPADAKAAAQTASSPLAAADASATYAVQKGDTLYGIAQSRGLTADDLARWNDISDPRRLQIGQELRLTAP